MPIEASEIIKLAIAIRFDALLHSALIRITMLNRIKGMPDTMAQHPISDMHANA